MRSNALFFTLATALFLVEQLSALSQPVCDSLDWKFPVNRFAIDGDELIADLEAKGWDRGFFETHQVTIRIEGATDCPGSFQYNTRLAGNRALYLRNYFEMAGYPEVRIEACDALPEKGCTRKNQGYNPNNRSASLWLCASEMEKAVQPEPVKQTEPAVTEAPGTAEELSAVNELATLEPGQTLVIGGLNFYPGSHRTLPEAKPVMKDLAQLMKDNPTLVIEVQGHVCCSNKPDEDGIDELTGKDNLSWARAKEVYDFLVREGIEPHRILYKGYAMKRPLVYPEVTIKDQIQNRRVEIMVVSK
jgi:outer membrane protein OmpA-like peptidoglycan-associated protein